MTDANVAPEGEVEDLDLSPEEEPYESDGARYIRVRAEAKAQAAVTMAAEAKAAQKAKAKRLSRQGQLDPELVDFNQRAKEIEQSINAKPVTDTEEA